MGEPIIVIGPTATAVSSNVLGLVSLISPINYCGDFRPYFSMYDPDCTEIIVRHDATNGKGIPATILGVTNPHFVKSLPNWPTVLVIPSGAYKSNSSSLDQALSPPRLQRNNSSSSPDKSRGTSP